METSFTYSDRDTAFFSSDERKWISKIRKLKEKYPDKINILAEPEDNDGCIYVQLPPSALKIAMRDSRTLTDEQRQEMMNNLQRAREAKQASSNS